MVLFFSHSEQRNIETDGEVHQENGKLATVSSSEPKLSFDHGWVYGANNLNKTNNLYLPFYKITGVMIFFYFQGRSACL